MKQLNRSVGIVGESIAIEFLKSKGYIILERNYSIPLGEIDIIASVEGYTVFVEVKARHSLRYGLPSEAVNKQKQHKISKVAALYIKKHRLYSSRIRFDVIEVDAQNGTVNHIEDAFYSTVRF